MIDAYDIAVRLATGALPVTCLPHGPAAQVLAAIDAGEAALRAQCSVPITPPPAVRPKSVESQILNHILGATISTGDVICAASLAGGMIAASGRPHTAAEAVALMREVLAEMAS